MAFDSGMTKEQAEASLESLDNMIVMGDEVWVPLEITLTDEGFYKAHRVGAREWRVANSQGRAALYKMEDSWKIYSPISAPGASSSMNLPDSSTICALFESSVDEWGSGELKSRLSPDRPVYVYTINPVPEKLTLMDTKSPYENETIIREDPFADSALLDVLALATNVVAVVPVPEIKEEDLEVFEDEEEEEKKDSDPNVIPEPEPTEIVIAPEPVIQPTAFVVEEAEPEPTMVPELVEGPTSIPAETEPEPIVETVVYEPAPVEEPKAEAIVEPVAEPEVTPEPVASEPEPVTHEPEPVTHEPEPVTPESEPVTPESESLVPEPKSVVPEPVEGPQPEQPKEENKSPLAKILLAIGGALAAAGIFIFAKKKKAKQ